MKRKEAIPLATEWSNVFMEYIEAILNDESVTSNLTFPTCKIDKLWWCAFDLTVSNGFKKSGATKIPAVHGSVLANQILEDLVMHFQNSEIDFSKFCNIKSMLGPNFYGISLRKNNSKMDINFAGIFPDEEHILYYENNLVTREQKGPTR